MTGFSLMNAHKFELKLPSASTEYALLAGGINSAEPANNEELAQDKYLDGGGFGETDVIGAQLVITFGGHRKYGDEAQDYIYENMLNLGAARRVPFRWTEPNGGKFEGECTIANIEGPSGEAGAKGEISFEMHFNGKPTYTPPGTAGSGTETGA